MVGALGVNQAMLFTVVFALGAFLAGFGGALQVAREPANLGLDPRRNQRCLRWWWSSAAWDSITGRLPRCRHHRRGEGAVASGSDSFISAPLPSTSPSSRWWQNFW